MHGNIALLFIPFFFLSFLLFVQNIYYHVSIYVIVIVSLLFVHYNSLRPRPT